MFTFKSAPLPFLERHICSEVPGVNDDFANSLWDSQSLHKLKNLTPRTATTEDVREDANHAVKQKVNFLGILVFSHSISPFQAPADFISLCLRGN